MKRRDFLVKTVGFSAVAACSLQDITPPRDAIYVLIDSSGTYYAQHDRVFRALRSILLRLNPGDSLRVAQINTCSFSDDAVLLSSDLPDIESQANQMKRAIAARLTEMRASLRSASNTDITGALLAASDYLNALDSDRRKILLFSDLAEDLAPDCGRSQDLEIDFTGVDVAAAFVIKLPGDNADPRRFYARQNTWRSRVNAGNARSWSVLSSMRAINEFVTQ